MLLKTAALILAVFSSVAHSERFGGRGGGIRGGDGDGHASSGSPFADRLRAWGKRNITFVENECPVTDATTCDKYGMFGNEPEKGTWVCVTRTRSSGETKSKTLCGGAEIPSMAECGCCGDECPVQCDCACRLPWEEEGKESGRLVYDAEEEETGCIPPTLAMMLVNRVPQVFSCGAC